MADIEINDFLIGRTSIYEYFFSAYYQAFSKELLSYTPAFIDTVTTLAANTNIPALETAAIKLNYFKKISNGIHEDEITQKLNACYSKLYITGDNIKMTEHSYRENELDKQTIMLNIVDFFLNNNIVKPSKINLPSDSLPIELYFMFRMSEKLVNTNDDGLEMIKQQQSFLSSHLSVWYNSFADATIERCDNKTLHVFYSALADACRGFLIYDAHLLEQLCQQMVNFDV